MCRGVAAAIIDADPIITRTGEVKPMQLHEERIDELNADAPSYDPRWILLVAAAMMIGRFSSPRRFSK
jgi:hypothetical protein